MKEPYTEDLANHSGHESCADNREVIREALDSGMYRLGIEPRKPEIRVPTWSKVLEGNTVGIVNARCKQTLRGRRPYTCTETLCAGTGISCN